MQVELDYSLKTAAGATFNNSAYLTTHTLPAFDPVASGFGQIDFEDAPAATPAATKEAALEPSAARGRQIYTSLGCVACHSIDGSTAGKSGPSWKGVFGSERELIDGSTTRADADYLRESILDPANKVTAGYDPKDVGMPSYRGILGEADVESLVLFIREL
jgi:cytochrome c2